MNIVAIEKAAQITIEIASKFKRRMTERNEIDLIFFSVLRMMFPDVPVTRQVHVTSIKGKNKPLRVDYRLGGSNPVMVELSVQPAGDKHQNRMYGSQNKSEGIKLGSYTGTEARLRIVVHIDLSKYPVSRKKLIASYQRFPLRNSRRGGPVRNLYVQRDITHSFRWPGSAVRNG